MLILTIFDQDEYVFEALRVGAVVLAHESGFVGRRGAVSRDG
ncbi:MAG: hypothetical protein ACXVFT_19680 [Solirubrobacteraceae bacterium]